METFNVYEKVLKHLLKIEKDEEGEYKEYIREEDECEKTMNQRINRKDSRIKDDIMETE